MQTLLKTRNPKEAVAQIKRVLFDELPEGRPRMHRKFEDTMHAALLTFMQASLPALPLSEVVTVDDTPFGVRVHISEVEIFFDGDGNVAFKYEDCNPVHAAAMLHVVCGSERQLTTASTETKSLSSS